MFEVYRKPGGFISAFFGRRRQEREDLLRGRAYETICRNSQNYPYYTNEETLAYELGISPRRAAEVLQQLLKDGNVEANDIPGMTKLFSPSLKQKPQSA